MMSMGCAGSLLTATGSTGLSEQGHYQSRGPHRQGRRGRNRLGGRPCTRSDVNEMGTRHLVSASIPHDARRNLRTSTTATPPSPIARGIRARTSWLATQSVFFDSDGDAIWTCICWTTAPTPSATIESQRRAGVRSKGDHISERWQPFPDVTGQRESRWC